MKTNLTTAIKLAKMIHEIAPTYGAHVALTGGCLYKDGERKDIDFIIYRVRQRAGIDLAGLFGALKGLGFEEPVGRGWVFKTSFKGVPVDLLLPEQEGGEYYYAKT